MIRIVALGTGGWIPSRQRETSCFLVLSGEDALLLDAGTGVRRLLETALADRLLANVKVLHILLSHFHLDHVIGITWLPGIWTKGIILYAPAPPLVQYEGDAAIATLTTPPLFSLPLGQFPGGVELRPVPQDGFSIGGMAITVMPQRHPGGSIGIRVNDAVAYCTDAFLGERHEQFAKGVRLALFDAMLPKLTYESMLASGREPDHGAGCVAARVAGAAHAAELSLIHIDPRLGLAGEGQLLQEAQETFTTTFIRDDLHEWRI